MAGLTSGTTYYAIKLDDNIIRLATTSVNAAAGTAINLTGAGNSNQTFSTDVVSYQIGANTGQSITVAFGEFNTAETDGTYGGAVNAATISVASTACAAAALVVIDTAIDGVDNQRAAYGAAINRLQYALDNLTNVSMNTSASKSRIMDTDYAKQTSELARTQIIQQAATAMLSQANTLPQTVLQLLQQ